MRWSLPLALLLSLSACTENRRGTGGAAPSGPVGTIAQSQALPKPKAVGPTPAHEVNEEPSMPSPDVSAARPLTERFALGPIDDIGPAAPMTATERGVLFVSRDSRLYLAAREGKDGFTALKAPRELFSRYGRGPATSQDYAYFVSTKGELCRGQLETGEVQVLAADARAGARVSVVRAAGRDLVGYIAGQEEEALGMLWAEGTRGHAVETLRLTPEGAAATSITLVPSEPHPYAVLLEGRTGMSPLHLRRLLVTARRVTPEEDEVVWVGPGSHPLTEIVSLGAGDKLLSFIATAKDVSHFGLAQLTLDPKAHTPVEPAWRAYPNGLDPAPVAVRHFCGGDFAVYAIPQHEKPRSPQDLVLAPIQSGVLGKEEVLAHSRAYNDISVAAVKGGAIVAWTADHRTWAMMVGCDRPR